MASIFLSATPICSVAPPIFAEATSLRAASVPYPLAVARRGLVSGERRRMAHIVRMAPEEQRLTRRNPLEFPAEWEKIKPGRRVDITPQFSPMKTPLPPPLPFDPPTGDEDEEEMGEQEEEEEQQEEEEQEESPLPQEE